MLSRCVKNASSCLAVLLMVACASSAEAQFGGFGGANNSNNRNNGGFGGNNSNPFGGNNSNPFGRNSNPFGGNNAGNGWGGWNNQPQRPTSPFNNNNGWNGNGNTNGCSGGLHRRASYGQCPCGNTPNINPWIDLLNKGIDELSKPQPPQNNNIPSRPPFVPQPQIVPNRPQPFVPQPIPQPRPQIVQPVTPVQPPATLKPNARPPEKLAVVRPNLSPARNLFTPINKSSYGLTGNAVEQEAEEQLEDIQTKLGPAANDPAVKAELDKMQEKLDKGEEITDADVDELKKAVVNAGGLPPTTNPSELDTMVGKLQGLSEANQALNVPYPPGGVTPFVPSGPTNIIYIPALPADEILLLPSGDLLTGTGGEGEIVVDSGDAADLLNLPLGVGEPVPDSDADVARRVKSGVLLMNPVENGVPIEYIVANQNYSMAPGFTQALSDGQSWVVNFDRGGGHGQARYTLTKGTYAFAGSDKGWELYAQTFEVTIDNSANQDPFYYVVDNTPAEVPPGQRQTHASPYPMLVRFERGEPGQEGQKKISKRGDVLVVAVRPEDGLWDLFPAQNFTQPSAAIATTPQEQPRKSLLKRPVPSAATAAPVAVPAPVPAAAPIPAAAPVPAAAAAPTPVPAPAPSPSGGN